MKAIVCDIDTLCGKWMSTLIRWGVNYNYNNIILMKRSEVRRCHRPTSSDASILRTHYFTRNICGSICQRFASLDVGRWNRWKSERSFRHGKHVTHHVKETSYYCLDLPLKLKKNLFHTWILESMEMSGRLERRDVRDTMIYIKTRFVNWKRERKRMISTVLRW